MNKTGQRGFTALELIVTMAVVAILLSMSVPAFKNYGFNIRMKTAMEVLQSDLKLARGNAISHNIHTIICPTRNGLDCSGQSAWQNGWMVFTDLNSDRTKQQTEPLLKHSGELELLSITSPNSRNKLRFLPNGSAPGSNVSILFCDQRGASKAGIITISNSGRIRLQNNGSEPSEICP